MASKEISDTGMTVVYEPQGSQAIVDIVFVHGLQGHPFKTWASKRIAKENPEEGPPYHEPPSSHASSKPESSGKNILPRLASRMRIQVSKNAKSSSKESVKDVSYVFWPRDLLPTQCSQARILVYGYDTIVTKYMVGATNKNSIFSHSKDLLWETVPLSALETSAYIRYPFIRRGRSQRGSIFKLLMFANCSASNNSEFEDILESTASVIFLGTPHRGSPAAKLGELARKLASMLMMDTNSLLLDSLTLKNSDLERSQEIFASAWRKYDFQVKTFQEGLPLSGLDVGLLNQKVVPDISSCLGDPRERAEILQANHMEMCRFSNPTETNYQKVAGELKMIYDSLLSLTGHDIDLHQKSKAAQELTPSEKKFLNSLRFPGMLNRQQTIDNAIENTGGWLMETTNYVNWINRNYLEKHFGLLQIKGKPGSGKSTLMKKAFGQVSAQFSGPEVCVVGYFFSSQGSQLQRSSSGLFRSLLYQMLPFHRDTLESLISFYSNVCEEQDDNNTVEWHQNELKSIFYSIFSKPGLVQRTIIFVDALDECDNTDIRDIAYSFREITMSAYKVGVELDICISMRHFPLISLASCPDIRMEDFNGPDISRFVMLKFAMVDSDEDDKWKNLQTQILQRSEGVFLWAVLVVDMLLKKRDLGRSMKYLEKRTKALPDVLEQLFVELLKDIHPTELKTTLRLFQWVFFATEPLRVQEWHHIMAFIREPPPYSLRKWRESEHYTETNDQLERQIRSFSRGLVEVKAQRDYELDMEDRGSNYAGAGSLDSAYGESRLIQPIHESVREFFLHGKGFSLFDQSLSNNFIGSGHLALVGCCLDYFKIRELDAFINARLRSGYSLPANSNPSRSRARRNSAASFGSSASSHSTGSLIKYLQLSQSDILDSFGADEWSESAPEISEEVLAKDPSVTGMSETLEDYPALQSYAVNRIFTHAKIAETEGIDPWEIVERLLFTDVWTRWANLQENVTKEKSLLLFLVEQGLVTWIEPLLEIYNGRFEDELEDALISAIERGDKNVMRVLARAVYFPQDHQREIIHKLRPLRYVILKSNLELLKELWTSIKSCVDGFGEQKLQEILNMQDENELSSLHLAIVYGDVSITEELIKYGADVELRSKSGATSLHIAAITGEACAAKESDTKVDSAPLTLRMPVLEAPSKHLSIIRLLLRLGRVVDVYTNTQRTPLHYAAARSCNCGVVEEILKYGADENAQDEYGDTPLHVAAKYCNESAIRTLLSSRADVNAQNKRKGTPLHFAAARGTNYSVLVKLLVHGADKSAQDEYGDTPLHVAARCCNESAIMTLLAFGADVNAQNELKGTPLHFAAARGTDYSVLEELLVHGADKNAQDEYGDTPLHVAARCCNKSAIRTLLSSRADVNAKNELKGTPLHLAAAARDHDFNVLKELLKHGADKNAQDEYGDTSLHVAATYRNESAIKTLSDFRSGCKRPE